MTIVVDASAVLQAAASKEGLDTLVAYQPVAPPLMRIEALSALHETYWRQEISRDFAVAIRDRLIAAPVEERSPPNLLQEAWEVAEALGWAKTYDAQCVALARLLKCRLVTQDRRLQRGAGGLIHIIHLADLEPPDDSSGDG